jgi:hypothetical protein
MQNEIPAGSKVKVAVTQKGVTTYQNAEVLAHMDGLVHVDLDGQAVSVDPSQIMPLDAPIEGMQVQSTAFPPPLAADPDNAQIVSELIAALAARVFVLETLPSYCSELHARIEAIEARLPAEGGVVNPPVPPKDPAFAVEETHSTESTTVAATGEAAAGN